MQALQRQNRTVLSMRIPVERIVDPEARCIVPFIVTGCSGKFARAAAAHFVSAPSLLGDGADLMFVDEQIRLALAREPDHAVVEVLNPAGDRLAIVQFHRYANLFFAEEAQVECFLPGITRRRRFLTPAGGVKGRHIDIVADGWSLFSNATEAPSWKLTQAARCAAH